MKGIIFTALEEEIAESHGREAWDEVLERAGVDGVYTTLGNYPDEELVQLLEAAEPLHGRDQREALVWFGRQALERLLGAYPSLAEGHTSTRSFVLTLNDIIHPEVRKLYPGADVPTFDYEEPDDGGLVLRYSSERELCPLAEGLIHGTADWFDETVAIEQPVCMLEGDDHCDLVLEISDRSAEGA